jgi:hypothetical protein
MSKRKKNFKRLSMATLLIPLVVALSVPQVRAQLSSNTISNITNGINTAQNIFGDLENLFSSFSIEDLFALGETAFDLESADQLPPEVVAFFEDNLGDLGPIREDVQENIRDGVNNGEIVGGALETNSANESEDLANASDRTLTNIQAQAHLSEEGQAKIQEEIDLTEDLLENVQQTAQDGQSDNVTQDVMKKLLVIQAQQTQVLGQSRADALRGRLDTQYTNINLANISKTLDAMYATERNKASASASGLMNMSAQGGAR